MNKKPTIDQMRQELMANGMLSKQQREANKAKFLEPSKVKDVLYHGTGADIKQFIPSLKTNSTFLSHDPYLASSFAENRSATNNGLPNVMPVHAQIKNPWDYENPDHVKAVVDELNKKKDYFGAPSGMDHEPKLMMGKWSTIENPQIQKIIKKLGHDSFYVKEGQKKNIGVYNQKAIKSAIGNRGTYDTSKPDITKAKGGSVEPKNTVKAYKLFRVHEKHPGKLFPLFVDANTPVEMNKWVDAKEGEMANGKVKSKIGNLAFRPGWHAGDVPVATHIGEKSDASLTAPDTRPHNHAWAEVEMPNDVDWQSEANRRGTNAQGKIIPVKAHITDQLPVGGHYRYKTNPNMTGNWLIGGSMKVNRVLTDAEVAKINKAHGLEDLPRAQKFNKKKFGFARGGIVAPEEWVSEEHVNHGVPKNIQPQFNALREELAHKAMLDKSYQKHIAKMPFKDIPSMQEWIRQQKEKGGVTHAHHLEIEERPL